MEEDPTRVLLSYEAVSKVTDLPVTPGDFTVKNTKLGMEICIEVKFDSIETK